MAGLLGAVLVCAGGSSVSAQERPAPAGARYTIEEDLPYGSGDPAQVLDLYLPDPAMRERVALVVVNYGSGDKVPVSRWFAERGYPVLFVNVRWRGGYPQPVRDAFCAVSWAHRNGSAYGFGSEGIFVLGHSGGAVLANHLGTVDDRALYLEECPHRPPEDRWLRGVISIAGLFDYRTEEEFAAPHNAYTPRYFGATKEEAPSVWAEASPITWVDGGEPPFLIVHGTADTMVLPAQSERSADILRRAGVQVEFVAVPGADHDTVLSTSTYELAESFIRRASGR